MGQFDQVVGVTCKHQVSSEFDLEAYIPYSLVRTQLWMHRVLQPERAASVREIANISQTESRVIQLVAQNQPITPSQVADKMGFDRAVVTRSINTLAAKHLVDLTPNIDDQRSKSLTLTSIGAQLCDALTSVMEDFSEHLNTLLSEKEKATLLKTLDKLLQGTLDYQQPQR